MSKSTQRKSENRPPQAGAPGHDLDRLYKAHQIHTLAQIVWAGLSHGHAQAAAPWTRPPVPAGTTHPGGGPSGLVYWYP